jgi:hypothetical protein
LDQAFKGGISRGKELGGFNSIFTGKWPIEIDGLPIKNGP